MDAQQKIKGFLERPEGTTGLIILSVLACAVGGVVLYNMEAIVKLLQNTIYAMFMAGSIIAVIALLLNDNFRWFCKSAFQSSMRALTSVWITIDPIGILKNYLLDMVEKLKKIEGYLEQLAGQITGLSQKIDTRKNNVKTFLKYAAAAQRNGDIDNVTLNANKAQREKEWVEEMSETLDQMQQTSDILKHMKRNLNLLYDDTEHRVDLLVDKYQAIKAAYKAMRGAKELIEGDRKKAIFEQDCEYIASDIGNKLGEMDRFFEASHSTFSNMDLQNDIFNKDGLALLSSWEKDGILSYENSRSLKPGAKVRISDRPGTDELELAEMSQAASNGDRPSSFSKIFERKQ
jgi:rubrerythrin